jgi:hypothetical protein
MSRFAMSSVIAVWLLNNRHRTTRPNQIACWSSADDQAGVPLEILAVEDEGGDLVVIHAMKMRRRYRQQYEEALPWRIVP